jgi:uncharacterized protein YeaO (DUF488 family)
MTESYEAVWRYRAELAEAALQEIERLAEMQSHQTLFTETIRNEARRGRGLVLDTQGGSHD